MNFLMTLFVGLATLVWGGFASMPLTPEAHWANTSITTSTAFVGCGTANSSGSLTTASKTASAEPSIYTPANFTVPTNITVGPIHWYLYALQVFADTRQHIAHYAFEAVIHPIPDTVVCDEIRPSRHGELIGVDKAECRPPVGLPRKNFSVSVTFHFAWKTALRDNLGNKGSLLIIKTNLPGVAHACPSFPYDACWAQGLYWVPDELILPTEIGDRYSGPEVLNFPGTYCRPGMPECAWSEYLY